MPKYFKITSISIFLVFVLSSFSFADDSVTITTYYPSPYGVYKEMRLYPNDSQNTCDANNKGAMYYDDSESQMKVCDGSSWQATSATPSGAVMFFNLTSCPTGWSELIAARGRYLVGLSAGGTLGGTAGTALSNQENRAVGQHSHSINDPGHSHSYVHGYNRWMPNVAAVGDGGNTFNTGSNTTGISINDSGAVPGTNAPYLQLLVCQKS